jgi:GntR family transcriptional regulator/MocR family aminotransferase
VPETTFYLDVDAVEPLQRQLRQRIIDTILVGTLQPGDRMPASRRLARDLGIARNTVTLTYQQLIADGYLVGRERSGVFVGDLLHEAGRSPLPDDQKRTPLVRRPWHGRMQTVVRIDADWSPPPSWELNPYPFLDGSYDASLSPLSEWRDAVRAAFASAEFNDWNKDFAEIDDKRLVHEIRTKALPRRGIQASPDEILIMTGARQAMALLCRALVPRNARVVVEEPGFPEFCQLARLQGAEVAFQRVDHHGMAVDEGLDGAQLVFLTPGCQYPTGAQLSRPRRKALLERAEREDMLLVEYDLPASGGFADKAEPALYSMDPAGRVVYVADLCDVLSPGLGIGFVVADAELIRDLRRLRALTGGGAPRSAQRIASFFLSLGHYEALMVRLHRVLRERLIALRDGFNYYLPQLVVIDPRFTGTAMWVEGPEILSARQLATEAAKRGILIEASDRFYSGELRRGNQFRMGVTGLSAGKIREGVALLAKVLQELFQPVIDRLDPALPSWLPGSEVAACMTGSKLLGRTTYGDPYEIDVLADGSLIGKCGYAHEDCDTGRWWMEDDYFCRQWSEWCYGEATRFLVVLEGDEMRWYRSDMVMFNRFVLRRPEQIRPAA